VVRASAAKPAAGTAQEVSGLGGAGDRLRGGARFGGQSRQRARRKTYPVLAAPEIVSGVVRASP